MAVTIRKRSPRAPLISLKEAVDRATKVYDKEGRHPASVDVVAKHLGYKSAENGAAKQALAAIGYYGLFERPSDGMIAVSKALEEYKFAPSEQLRTEILRKWLVTPGVFAELLEKFPDRLPSDASLKFELIQKGFNPATADECLTAFLESVRYVESLASPQGEAPQPPLEASEESESVSGDRPAVGSPDRATASGVRVPPSSAREEDESADRIPVRLAGGRRAWLVIPSPFYEADKRRLISQIELLLTDDDE